MMLVLGAGGFLGLNTVRACLDAGITPRCGRRPRGNVLGLRGLGALGEDLELRTGGERGQQGLVGGQGGGLLQAHVA